MSKIIKNEYIKVILILLMSASFILFTQYIKTIKSAKATPITLDTIQGLLVLCSFAFIGFLISKALKKFKVKIIANFPILGWVSITSLIFCLISDYFVKVISAVDFLSITTPILAFAGISVANSLQDLKSTSWKVAFVAIFVFIGTYLGSAIIAQIGLILSGK